MALEVAQSRVELSGLRKDFLSLLRKHKILDKSTGWIRLRNLWFDHPARQEYARIIKEYLDALFPGERLTLLIPDLVVSNYNLLPVAFIAAHERRDRVSVWAEVGDVVDGLPVLYRGKTQKEEQCVLLQDVIDTGVTMQKVAPEIANAGWRIRAVVVLIEAFQDPDPINRSLEWLKGQREIITEAFGYYPLIDANDI